MSEAIDFRYVGTRPVRPDGVDKVTGRANYGADFSLPGMIHGRVLRSPHAHARILRIDTSKALAMDGVLAVVAGDDFPALGEVRDADLAVNVIARDRVLYHGHAVAAVAATSTTIADHALEAIEVEYEPLQALMSMKEAMAPDAPLLYDDIFTRGLPETPTEPSNIPQKYMLTGGDLEAGFKAADVVVEGEYSTSTVHQGYIEPHACVANINEEGRATVWCSTQGHFGVRGSVAGVLGMDVSKIKVIPSEIGGGFGGKLTLYLEPLAVLMSQRSSRPVKMVMTREEVFRASGPVSATRSRVKIGAKRDGTLTAMQAELWYEAGRLSWRWANATWMHVHLRRIYLSELPHRGLHRGGQQTQGRRLPCAGFAAVELRWRIDVGRTGSQAGHGPHRVASEERR